jgi:hypothetical protein
MGFFSSNSVVQNQIETPPPSIVDNVNNNLSKEEISLVLDIVRQTTFKGENIEPLYNLVLKLQNQYLSLDK